MSDLFATQIDSLDKDSSEIRGNDIQHHEEIDISEGDESSTSLESASPSDGAFFFDCKNSFSSTRLSTSTMSTAFSPVKKHISHETVPSITNTHKSLSFGSPSPNTSISISADYDPLSKFEAIPISATSDLITLDDCPPVSNYYEKEYITYKRLGSGHFTIVDLVYCKVNKQMYAIKRSQTPLTKTSDRKRSIHECLLYSEVKSCPNLVKYYKCWQEDSFVYILMDICSRGSLESVIINNAIINEDVIWYTLCVVLRSLAYLHQHDIVHLDIKPENLLINEQGEILVCDLGCASHINETSIITDRRYMASEGLDDVSIPDRDIFSLGMVVYYMMTKEEPPVSGERWIAIREGTNIPYISNYSSDLNDMMKKMIRSNNRGTASELLTLLPKDIDRKMVNAKKELVAKTVSTLEGKKSAKRKLTLTIDEKEDGEPRMSTPVDQTQITYGIKFVF